MTTQELINCIEKHDKNQSSIGLELGFSRSKMTRLVKGAEISDSDSKLLNLYFHGILPFDMLAPSEGYTNNLDFNENEWRVINILAKRAGFTNTSKWIVSKIREYLAFLDATNHQEEVNITPLVTSENIEYVDFNFFGSVAAGQPVETQLIGETLSIRSSLDPHSHAAVEVNGQSAEPEFMDGDRWLIELVPPGQTFTAKNNKPAVFADENGCYLKKFDRKNKKLVSVNSNHPEVVPGDSMRLVGYPVEMVQSN